MNWSQKLYTFLHATNAPQSLLDTLFTPTQLNQPKNDSITSTLASDIANSSDRINLRQSPNASASIEIRHPISGKAQDADPFRATANLSQIQTAIAQIQQTIEQDQTIADKDTEIAKQRFWWFWRFYPELLANQQPNTNVLLFPAHPILPDCSWHSYASTVSALNGALSPHSSNPQTPYLLHFTFSPVQEFIKASRKFLDFWAGSYLLHYLSVKLCWYIAQKYGPDSIIVPSLWSQEIVDALMMQTFDQNDSTPFRNTFRHISKTAFNFHDRETDPIQRFNERLTTSLSTAGFPNAITVLVPGEQAAKALGKELTEQLKHEWLTIGLGHQNEQDKWRGGIQDHIRDRVIETLQTYHEKDSTWETLLNEFKLSKSEDPSPYQRDLEKWLKPDCWHWRNLWQSQLENTWEPYWTAIPLGIAQPELSIPLSQDDYETWKTNQNDLAQDDLPSTLEEKLYDTINIGTWWGSIQQRLRVYSQSIKNDRTWKIPCAPGTRSTLSGQFSAVHPALRYQAETRFGQDLDLREGSGLPFGSMRLFWFVMSKAYPGLFNGSEQLNALELTKRMAWVYGGVAESLGIQVSKVVKHIEYRRQHSLSSQSEQLERILYERFVRFPNVSSIATARFIHDHPKKTADYWTVLHQLNPTNNQRLFQRLTRIRPTNIPKTDHKINPHQRKRQYYNGAMFSSKWLAEDLGLDQQATQDLRFSIDRAHKESGFGDSSPSDWWAIVLADGDNMGQYISGTKLKHYGDYIVDSFVDQEVKKLEQYQQFKSDTPKRMGPATHIGLNRALLDFSNRLVPYLAEQRCCGRVIYSGGDDVMVVLPLEDVPLFVRSLRAAWSAETDPNREFDNTGDYWRPKSLPGLPNRPLFTMGNGATMSMGVVFAHKSVPLPTVLETLWSAEKKAKEFHHKDGLCFRVIYSNGNQLEALMKGNLLEDWWNLVQDSQEELSPLLYRLSEELPKRASLTEDLHLFSKAAKVIIDSRDETRKLTNFDAICKWLDDWEKWAYRTRTSPEPLGTKEEDLGNLLRFSAFWVDKMAQRRKWEQPLSVPSEVNR
jgi:CRISPR-associated protein Cmr2